MNGISVIGKGKRNIPFSIKNRAGEFFYISTEGLDKLTAANNAYKKIFKSGEVEPIKRINIVGRGGKTGYKPFLLRGKEKRYLCISSNHYLRLLEIYSLYKGIAGDMKEEPEKEEEPKEEIEKEPEKEEEPAEEEAVEEKKEELEAEEEIAEERAEEEAVEEKEEPAEEAEEEPKVEEKTEEEKVAKAGMKFCQGCGKEIKKTWKFHKCGWKEKEKESEEKAEKEEIEEEEIPKEGIKKEATKEELEAIAEKYKKKFEEKEREIAEELKKEKPGEETTAEEEPTEAKAAEEKEKEEGTEAEEEEQTKGKYVYCIIPHINENLTLGNIGLENSKVYTMNIGKITAVVSDVLFKDFPKTEENIRIHDEVVRKVLENFTVLPMSFGMVFTDKNILRTVLKRSRRELKRALKEIEGSVELGIKILTNGGTFNEDAFAEDVKNVRRLAINAKLGKKFSEKLILNASYLVKRDFINKFSEEVDVLQGKYPQLKIQFTGPWAPYNFVDINIGGS